jgi:serine protease AprX
MNYEKININLLRKVKINALNKYECIVLLNKVNGQFINNLRSNNIDYKYFSFINAVALNVDYSQLDSYSTNSEVQYITTQSIVSTDILKSKEVLNTIPFYKSDIYGKINVAVIDTGIGFLPDFCIPRVRIIKFVDLINNKKEPYDDNGHGTFVSGVICGNGLISGKKYMGIAPEANIIAIKALDKSGETGAFKILEAMQWIYDNYELYDIKVVCMSFGSEPLSTEDPLVLGVESLWKCGIVVVVAGGNSGPKPMTIKSPGVSEKVITVGGLDDGRGNLEGKFKVAPFSSRGPTEFGPKPDILAPSINIISNAKKIVGGKGYTKMSGTSVATPMIAGICALILQKYPYLTVSQVKNYIKNCGVSIGDSYNNEGSGYFRTGGTKNG